MPVVHAMALLKLERGYGERDHEALSDVDGGVRMDMNEPPSVWATLRIQASGYQRWSRQFRGQPASRVELCLNPLNNQSGSFGRERKH
jgi:hypothetical protein